MALVADTAVVHRCAELDSETEIGPYAVIGPHVRIGSGSTVGSHAVIDGFTRIGRDCRIFPHAAVGLEPQDLKFRRGIESYLKIGDRTTIREFVTLNPGTAAGDTTTIGDDCLLMTYSHVAHNCRLGNHVILANSVNLAGHVEIDDYAVIGGVTPVHQFVRIGAHAMVGGGSRIPQDVAPFMMVAGNPAVAHGVNALGLSRRGYSQESIKDLKTAYRILFRKKLVLSEALEVLQKSGVSSPEIDHLVDFVQSSERGVTR